MVFFVSSILNCHSRNWRRQHLNLCLCCWFCPIFAPNMLERKCLRTNNCCYSRLICIDALCKSISIIHFIEKAVFHMPLKSLVLNTYAVIMAWRVSLSFSVWQNGAQPTIDRCWFIPSLCHAHDIFFCLLISCTLINVMQVWTKGSVAVGSTEMLIPLSFNVDLSGWYESSSTNNQSSIISCIKPPIPPLFLHYNHL